MGHILLLTACAPDIHLRNLEPLLPVPHGAQRCTLVQGKTSLTSQTSAEVLPLLLGSSLPVHSWTSPKSCSSSHLASPPADARALQKAVPNSPTSEQPRFGPRGGKQARGRTPLHLFLGQAGSPSCCLCFTRMHASCSWHGPKSHSIACDQMLLTCSVTQGMEERGAKQEKTMPKTWVSHTAPLGGVYFLFSISPGSFPLSWCKPRPVVERDFVRM